MVGFLRKLGFILRRGERRDADVATATSESSTRDIDCGGDEHNVPKGDTAIVIASDPQTGASFWDAVRCAIRWHDWAVATEADLTVKRSVPYGGFMRNYGTANVRCLRSGCSQRYVFETHVDTPHEDISLYQPNKKNPDAPDARCQNGEHEFNDPPTTYFGSTHFGEDVERQHAWCQREGCKHGFLRFRMRLLSPSRKLSYSDWVDNPFKFVSKKDTEEKNKENPRPRPLRVTILHISRDDPSVLEEN